MKVEFLSFILSFKSPIYPLQLKYTIFGAGTGTRMLFLGDKPLILMTSSNSTEVFKYSM